MTASDRQPVFNVPPVVLALLAVLASVHLLRVWGPITLDEQLIGWLSFVPIRLTALFAPGAAADHVALWGSGPPADAASAELAQFFLAKSGVSALPTLLTYALLHGSWTHLGLNAIWLLAFGTPVARRFGTGRFLVFFAIAVIAGAAMHWALFPFAAEPLIGASAGISGCMGAAVRFAFRTPGTTMAAGPDESLAATLRDRRALVFIVIWFATNALFGAGSASFGFTDQPVAWQAHIGGFLAGLLLFPVFARSPMSPLAPETAAEPPLAP